MSGWLAFIKTSQPVALLGALRNACAEAADWIPVDSDPERERAFGQSYFHADYRGSAFPGRGLYLFVTPCGEEPSRVQLTMHAERWGDDRRQPTADEYARAIQLASPLLQRAGKLLGKHLRLCRPPPDRVRPLRGVLDRALRSVVVVYEPTFGAGEQLEDLDPRDHERYWRFIRLAHQHQSTLRPKDVAFHLAAAGLGPELVTELEREYEIGRQVLALHHEPWDLRRLRKEERRSRNQRDLAEH